VRTPTGDLPGKGDGSIGGKSLEARLKKKGRRVYTEKELEIPKLNMITPVGVEKPKGGKKGKVFVDDRVCVPLFACFFTLTVYCTSNFKHLGWRANCGLSLFIGKYDDYPRYGECG